MGVNPSPRTCGVGKAALGLSVVSYMALQAVQSASGRDVLLSDPMLELVYHSKGVLSMKDLRSLMVSLDSKVHSSEGSPWCLKRVPQFAVESSSL